MKELPDACAKRKPLTGIARDADHVEVLTFSSRRMLREFIARMLCRRPAWLRGLHAARRVLTEALGLSNEAPPLRTPYP